MISASWVMAMACSAPLLLAAPQLRAQSTLQRTSLSRLRDSLEHVGDVAALRVAETALIDVARSDRDNAMLHLRLGLLALRLHAVDSVPHVDDAIGEFEWAVSLQPEWPWAWFGLGVAEAAVRDRSSSAVGGLWYMLGLDRESRSSAAFARAIHADPTFVDGILALGRTAQAQRIDAPIAPALDALRGATATPVGWHPDLLLERGRLERLGGSADSAVRMFTLAALLSRRTDLALLELARTLPLLVPDSSVPRSRSLTASKAYYAAASSDDPELIAMYRRDLEPIAPDSSLRRFDALDDTARVHWLRDFWHRRAALDLRADDDRLEEHFQRWAFARREFRLPPFRRRYNFGTELFRSGDLELDDRGVIWLRHGEPSLRIEWPTTRHRERSLNGQPISPNHGNESWRYDRPEGALVLHFVAETDPHDFRVVESPAFLDVPGDVIALRADELPGVARLLRVNEESPAWSWVSEEVRLLGRRSMGIATGSDSWERQYATRLGGRAQWFAVGIRTGQPLVHIVYAVDAGALREAFGSWATVPLHVRAVAFDSMGVLLGGLDTVQVVPVPAPGVQQIAMRAELPVQPGTVRVRLGVEASPALGAVYPLDSLIVPKVGGDSLVLSAILVGRAGPALPWPIIAADTAWIDASGVYAPGDTLVVYAEAYGLRAGASAMVQLSVTRRRTGLARLLGASATEIALTEPIRVPGNVLSIRRSLALGGLEPGSYVLELKVVQGSRITGRRRGLVIR
ncbi:MAG: hypothetical protein ABIR59_03445 [Gemmatimonadales bacterium]